MFLKRLLFLALILLMINCSEDGIVIPDSNNSQETPIDVENPIETEVYFTFKSFERTIFVDNWIILHTSDGVLLDYKRYEKGDEFFFEAETSLVTDFISVTLFSFEKYGNNHYANFYTTFDVKKGSKWNQPPNELLNEEDDIVGEFNVILENFPEIIGLNISNENNLLLSGFYHGPSTIFRNKYTYKVENIPLYEENEYAISFNEDQEDFKYYFLKDVKDLEEITINYEDFKFFDSYLDVQLPENSYYKFAIKGLEDYHDINSNSGFVVEKAHYSEDGYKNEFLDRSPLRIGYLDRFINYDTELTVFTERFNYSFKRRGEKPTEINIPESISFFVSDNSMDNFGFDFDQEYIKSVISWNSDSGTYDEDYINCTWQIEKDKNSDQLLGDIPTEILAFYPIIDLELLTYDSADFWLNNEEKIFIN